MSCAQARISVNMHRWSGNPFQTLALRAISFSGPNRLLPGVDAKVLDLLFEQVDRVSGVLDCLLS